MTRGAVLPVVDIDIRSAYPGAFSLLGCWDTLGGAGLREVDATDELRSLAAQVAGGDLSPLYDPDTYSTMGLCLAEVIFRGEYGSVELRGEPGQQPSFHVAQLFSDGMPLSVTWSGVILTALLSGRVPEIVSATRLQSIGKEHARRLPLRGGQVVRSGDDPVSAGVRLRSALKEQGEKRLPVQLRVFLNAMSWGVFARLDQYRISGGRGRRSLLAEVPSVWSWPPIASSVPEVARMWLAMVDRMVTDLGGVIVTRDTDGCAILSMPATAQVTLAGGQVVHALSWSEVDELVASFDSLDPFGDGRPFWTIERGSWDRPLHLLSLGQKRYVKAQPGPSGWEVIGGTEHSLGGGVVDPPTMPGRDTNRRHVWTFPVAEHALARAIASGESQQCSGFVAPWDGADDQPFPRLSRFAAASPKTLAELPEALGAHPFAPIVDAHPNRLLAATVNAPVALDPGTHLAEWPTLDWHDGHGPVHVTTTEARTNAGIVPLQTLREFAEDWSRPRSKADPGELLIDHRLVRRVGRGGALVDAQLADPDVDVDQYQVVYDGGDPAAFVSAEARRLGYRAFARRTGLSETVAKRAATGKPISTRNVGRAMKTLTVGDNSTRPCSLDGCNEPVSRPNANYCSKAHRDRAYRGRKATAHAPNLRSRRSPAKPNAFAELACSGCGTVLLGKAAQGRCPMCPTPIDRAVTS